MWYHPGRKPHKSQCFHCVCVRVFQLRRSLWSQPWGHLRRFSSRWDFLFSYKLKLSCKAADDEQESLSTLWLFFSSAAGGTRLWIVDGCRHPFVHLVPFIIRKSRHFLSSWAAASVQPLSLSALTDSCTSHHWLATRKRKVSWQNSLHNHYFCACRHMLAQANIANSNNKNRSLSVVVRWLSKWRSIFTSPNWTAKGSKTLFYRSKSGNCKVAFHLVLIQMNMIKWITINWELCFVLFFVFFVRHWQLWFCIFHLFLNLQVSVDVRHIHHIPTFSL